MPGISRILQLPECVCVVYGMCLGWPDEAAIPQQKPRLPEELVIHFENHNDQDFTKDLREYDATLARHYDQLGTNFDQAAWTGPITKSLKKTPRAHLRAELESLGFSFE